MSSLLQYEFVVEGITCRKGDDCDACGHYWKGEKPSYQYISLGGLPNPGSQGVKDMFIL